MTNTEAIRWMDIQRTCGVQWDDYSPETERIRKKCEEEIQEAYKVAIAALKATDTKRKFYITRTSDSFIKPGKIREYSSLDSCCRSLLSDPANAKELVVSFIPDWYKDASIKDCEYEVEIYDTYRE